MDRFAMGRALIGVHALQMQMSHSFGEILLLRLPRGVDARQLRDKRFERLLDHDVLRFVTELDADVGEFINRPPRFQQAAQRLLGIVRVKQRTVVLATHALHQRLEIGVEPDRDAALADALAGARVHEGAAAGGEHHLAGVQQTHDHAALAVAEIALAIFGENLGNGHAGGGGDDFGVGVDEGKAEARGQALADGALAGAHHADEDERASGQRRANGGGALVPGAGRRRRRRNGLRSYHGRQSIPGAPEIQPVSAARARKACMKEGSRGSS